MAIVTSAGSGVTVLKPGGRIVLTFNGKHLVHHALGLQVVDPTSNSR